ncbi:MAG: hypothetical protein M1823_007876, partial [Watsoniomyces obsoletus]
MLSRARRERRLAQREQAVGHPDPDRGAVASTGTGHVPDRFVTYLRQMTGPAATWKTAEQRTAMLRIMNMRTAEDRLIVVLPTGGGKSVLFTLPSIITPTRTNVVVVPFAAPVLGRMLRGEVDLAFAVAEALPAVGLLVEPLYRDSF